MVPVTASAFVASSTLDDAAMGNFMVPPTASAFQIGILLLVGAGSFDDPATTIVGSSVVGESVFVVVGAFVSSYVGVAVAANVGSIDGMLDGTMDSTSLGFELDGGGDGIVDGTCEGTSLGCELGAEVGESVGVRLSDGASVVTWFVDSMQPIQFVNASSCLKQSSFLQHSRFSLYQ